MTKQIQEAYIVAAQRSPVGKAPRGSFKTVRPDDLLAHVLRGTLAQVPSVDPARIQDVVVGCAMPEAEQGMNVARIGVLLAGFPNVVPGVTINRFCASGIEAVARAANTIQLGNADLVFAAGTESMSLIPMMGHRVVMNPHVFDNENMAIAFGMGITAENVAQRWKIDRESQDKFALESHRRATAALERKDFSREILPYEWLEGALDAAGMSVVERKRILSQDEGPRADSTYEALAKLKPVFAAQGTVTAGNSSQMSDGAAAILLASEKAVKEFNLTPIARFVSYAVAGVPPEIMGIGPIEAIPLALRQAGLKLNQIDWIELNEAFAAQALAVIREVGLDPAKVNPLGGAIALGHPLGATGAIRTATVIHGLRRTKQKYGMVTMCIGTGMGAAGIIEAL